MQLCVSAKYFFVSRIYDYPLQGEQKILNAFHLPYNLINKYVFQNCIYAKVSKLESFLVLVKILI